MQQGLDNQIMQPGMQRCIKISAGNDLFLKHIGWATDCFQLLLFDKAYYGGSCHGFFSNLNVLYYMQFNISENREYSI